VEDKLQCNVDVDSAPHSRQAVIMAGPVRLHKQTVAQQHQEEEELASLWGLPAAGATAPVTTLNQERLAGGASCG